MRSDAPFIQQQELLRFKFTKCPANGNQNPTRLPCRHSTLPSDLEVISDRDLKVEVTEVAWLQIGRLVVGIAFRTSVKLNSITSTASKSGSEALASFLGEAPKLHFRLLP